MTYVLPNNIAAEEAVIGGLLVADAMGPLLNDVRLEPQHFYIHSHGAIYQAAAELHAIGESVDMITVSAHLDPTGGQARQRWQELCARLAMSPTAPSTILSHARLVMEAAQWRHYHSTLAAAQQALATHNREALMMAVSAMSDDVTRAGDTYDPQALYAELEQHLTAENVDVFPWPLEGLNRQTGGIFRGEFAILAGWTSHGKSVFVDQMLENVAKRGFNVHLYINEMMPKQRVIRTISRRLGMRFQDIAANRVSEPDRQRILAEAGRLPYGITDCTGWSGEEIGQHMRQHRWDFAVVDILHEIPYEDEGELRQHASALNRAAKQANTALVACAHLSEHRAHKGQLPPPVLSDIRGSGMLKNASDFTMFVYIKPGSDETGFHPQGDGMVYIAKGRNTGVTSVPARLVPGHFRWEPRSIDGTGPVPSLMVPASAPAPVSDLL